MLKPKTMFVFDKSLPTVMLGALVIAMGSIVLSTNAFAQGGPPAGYQVTPDQDKGPDQVGSDFIATREIPAGTPIKVILLSPASSDYSQPGDPVKVRVAPDDTSGVPKSIIFVGHIRDAVPATHNDPGILSLHFDELSAVGRWQPAGDATAPPVEEASARFVGGNQASGGNSDVAIGAAAGAVVGGSRKRKLGDIIEGGLLGALGGFAVQKATTHPATDIELKSGQEVTITLRHPITIKTELIAS